MPSPTITPTATPTGYDVTQDDNAITTSGIPLTWFTNSTDPALHEPHQAGNINIVDHPAMLALTRRANFLTAFDVFTDMLTVDEETALYPNPNQPLADQLILIPLLPSQALTAPNLPKLIRNLRHTSEQLAHKYRYGTSNWETVTLAEAILTYLAVRFGDDMTRENSKLEPSDTGILKLLCPQDTHSFPYLFPQATPTSRWFTAYAAKP